MRIKPGTYALIISVFAFLVNGDLLGQRKDFQSWWEFELEKGLKNGLNLSGELEQRFKSNGLQYDRTLLTVAGDYDFNNYFGITGGLRSVFVADRELNMHTKFRIHADATGMYHLSGFEYSLRVRFQYGFEDPLYVGYFRENTFVNRNRLKVQHHIFGTRFRWYVTIESWHLFSDSPQKRFYKMRYSAGVKYTLNFRSSFGIRYILEDELNVTNPMQTHIAVLGYSHNL